MSSFCLGCGNSMAEGERFCAVCGRDAQAGASAPPIDPAVAWGLLPETSGKAIFSLICGIFFIIPPFSFMGVIFGYIALSEIRKNPGRLTGRGFAITGIALSYIGVALTVFLFGLGIYGIRKASKEANRGHTAVLASPKRNSVVSAIRTLNTAEIAYAQVHPEAGYTCSIPDLPNAWLKKQDLTVGDATGYTFELKNCSHEKRGSRVTKYQVLAYPKESNKQGVPVYCSDESDVIRIWRGGTPEDCLKTGRELTEKEITHPPTVSSQSSK